MKKFTFITLLLLFISFCSSDGTGSVVENQPNNEVEVSENIATPNPEEQSSNINTSVVDNFLVCMQQDGLDFYFEGFDENGDPIFSFYENEGVDPMMVLNEDCFSQAEQLAIQTSLGVEGFLEYLMNLFFTSQYEQDSDPNDPYSQTGTLTTKEECNEYGCIKVTTGLDTWLDGEVIPGLGISNTAYSLWSEKTVVDDFVNFDVLEPLQKVARWAAQSTVIVIGDRCFDTEFEARQASLYKGYPDAIHLTTDSLSGFFIGKDYIITKSTVSYTLQQQEDYVNQRRIPGEPGEYGSPIGTGYKKQMSCNETEVEYNNDPINKDEGLKMKLIQGEGPIVQLFDGTYGSGQIVYSDNKCTDLGDLACDGISIIKLEKYTDNVFSAVETWSSWADKREEIIPLPIRSKTEYENKDVVYIHHPWEGNEIGGWYMTVANIASCKGNITREKAFAPDKFFLQTYSDEGSEGAPILDDEGFVIGMISGTSGGSNKNTCGNVVARSNDRNNLGVLSSFLYDGLDISEAWDAEKINSSIASFQSIETSFVPVSNPDIKEIYKWPLNALSPQDAVFETYDYDDSFTESGFPKVELNSPAFEIAKQATLIFVKQTACTNCLENAKDENFSIACACTAFAVTQNLIVTNDHCISGLEVGDKSTFKTYGGQNVEGTLIGRSRDDGNPDTSELYKELYPGIYGEGDPSLRGDVALFRTNIKMDLVPVKIADSKKLKQHDPIISVGHPGKMSGSGPFVVTAGSILGENWTLPGNSIQFHLPASPGSSGSGVFNLNGELVAQVCCGGSASGMQKESIAFSKYGLIATGVSGGFANPSEGLMRGIVHNPRPYKFSKDVEISLGATTSGAPSNYIKDLIEMWAPGELGY